MPSTPEKAANPLLPFYAWVKERLAVANGVILMGGSVASALDYFIVPQEQYLPAAIVIYASCAVFVVFMVAAALFPEAATRLLAAFGMAPAPGRPPFWRRPGWILTAIGIGVVAVAGCASLPRAQAGGAIASASPKLRSVQELLLANTAEVRKVGAGVDEANRKLDVIGARLDPADPTALCNDLACALYGGASSATVRRLFGNGARVSGHPVNDGQLLRMAAISRGQGRMETVDLLFQHGVPRSLQFMPQFLSPGEVSREGVRRAREVKEATSYDRLRKFSHDVTGNADLRDWNDVMGCFHATSGGVTMLELSSLLGDMDMVAHLIAGGSRLPERPLVCLVSAPMEKRAARVHFDPATARVVAVRPA
jgi:hypothetical protein